MDLVAISRPLFSFSMNSQIFETLFRVHLSTQFDVLGSSGRFATNLKKWVAFVTIETKELLMILMIQRHAPIPR